MNLVLATLASLLLVPPAPPPVAPVPLSQVGSSAAPSASPTRVPSAVAVRPVPGPVLAGFDPPEQRWDSGHRGVDLSALPAEAVRAALPGTVTFAGRLAGRGVVVVDHGLRRTTYEPVYAWVEPGDPVTGGDVIGILEPGPGHCFPASCLHWGLRAGEDYLDPLSLLGPRRVRLLPLLEP